MAAEQGTGRYSAESVRPQELKTEYHFSDRKATVHGRIGEIVSGALVRPHKYVVGRKVLQRYQLRDEYWGSEFMRGEMPASLHGLSLTIRAYNHLLKKDSEASPHLTMNLVADTATQTYSLAFGSISCWIILGGKNYELDYREDGEHGQASLVRVEPLYGPGPVYIPGNPLSERKITKLKLEEKGFPHTIDWMKTLQMYTLGKRPDASGQITASCEPLTAEDIYKQTLLPA